MASLPPFFLDTVLALGSKRGEGEVDWFGSTFLYGFRSDRDGPSVYRTYLITTRTAFQRLAASGGTPFVRNPAGIADQRDFQIRVNEEGFQRWWTHPNPSIDIAVTPVAIDVLRRASARVAFFQNDAHALVTERMRNEGVSEGDSVFILGFAPDPASGDQHPVVRSGIIGRIRELYAQQTDSFVLDAPTLDGSGGEPVIFKPDAVSAEGGIARKSAHLIGVVRSPSWDLRHSTDSNASTLAQPVTCHPVNFIDESILQHLASLRERSAVSS